MIFTDYWRALVLNFSEMGNTVFLWSQKVDEKIIFTWYFWVFHDIPGPGKYGFLCSDHRYFRECYKLMTKYLSKQHKDADPKAIQQINFTGNFDRDGNTHNVFH